MFWPPLTSDGSLFDYTVGEFKKVSVQKYDGNSLQIIDENFIYDSICIRSDVD